MTARRSSHRRASGSIRRLSSGSWQARYTGPDGAMRTLGTFATKVEADQALAHEVSRMARGLWHDPRLGDQRLGYWFQDWISGRADLAESTRALYLRLLDTWIDAPLSVVERPSGVPRVVHLGARTVPPSAGERRDPPVGGGYRETGCADRSYPRRAARGVVVGERRRRRPTACCTLAWPRPWPTG